MKVVSIGADISFNDVYCSESLISNVSNDIYKLIDLGAEKAALTNVTGDDLVISAFVKNKNLKTINQGIIDILKNNAEDFGDLNGISDSKSDCGEGVSYAEAKIREDRYPDAIILAFDTYGGELFVENVANSAIKAARGMDNLTDVCSEIKNEPREIPGVGYVSNKTDDPVICATVEDIESVGVISGAMIGAAVGNKNVFFVERGTPTNVIPGSVIMSATAFMNGNVIDLAVPFQQRATILR